jgi:hypothetical protein
MGHISVTWNIVNNSNSKYWRKSMINGEKIWTWKDWQGDFIETKAKKSPISPGLVSPEL